MESTESIPGHFSRRIVKRTLSDDSLSKAEPIVNNPKPIDAKSAEVKTYLILVYCFNIIRV